jgi:hypothetical protein
LKHVEEGWSRAIEQVDALGLAAEQFDVLAKLFGSFSGARSSATSHLLS